MYKVSNGYVIAFFMLLAFFVCCTTSNAQELPNSQLDNSDEANKELKKRLKQLEPPEPVNIIELPFETEAEKRYPSHTVPISQVIDKGTNIPFDVIKNIPEYKRPVYEKHWHSTVGRWSYVPTRIHYALHRLFTNYDIGLSNWYDFEGNLGVYNIPMFQNETALDLYIVVFQTAVTDVYTRDNQVIVVGNPKRNGVEVITIKTGDVHPANKKELLLIQLATTSGHELDYSLILYESPDFWLKQKKLKERER